MTEDDAQSWVIEQFGSPARDRLALLVALIEHEAPRQNLISASSMEHIWARHIVDSAQLVTLSERGSLSGGWLDIGTGAGFPGLVVAALTRNPMLMVEPRRKRAAFLEHAIAAMGLTRNATIRCAAIEATEQVASVISARAVASIEVILAMSRHCARADTLWILPKGRTAREEVAQASKAWHGLFHVEQSVTDAASLIVLVSGVSRR